MILHQLQAKILMFEVFDGVVLIRIESILEDAKGINRYLEGSV